MQARFEPTPEQAAHMRESQRGIAAYHARIASQLAASGKPRELAFAATLQRFADEVQGSTTATTTASPASAQETQWLREAAAKAGDDVIAWTLLLQDDASSHRNAAAHWQALEPGNLAAWIAGDAASEALFDAVRRTTYYDGHMYPRVRWMAGTLRAHPPTAEEAKWLMAGDRPDAPPFDLEEFSAMAAFGIDMAVAMPALMPLTDGCRDEALQVTATRRDTCRHVAGLLLDKPRSLQAESIGIALLGELARNPAEQAAVAERRRQFDWRMQQFMQLMMKDAEPDNAAFLRLFNNPDIDNEIELTERLLREAGVPLQPPADWEPSYSGG